jgi:[ribosomal protein S5]-alanine N-acetyltransferase
MRVIETDRLTLRFASIEDAEFILELLNDPDWLKFIGDRSVTTIEQARDYISQNFVRMYEDIGFGLYLVETKDRNPIGICGLVKRDYLQDIDLGFAFLPKYRRNGFAFEAADAVIKFAKQKFGVKRFVAITSQDNENSIKLLKNLGLQYEQSLMPPDQEEQVKLFAINFDNLSMRA